MSKYMGGFLNYSLRRYAQLDQIIHYTINTYSAAATIT